jgi:hypothetical protein
MHADFVSNQAGDTPHFRHQGRNSKTDHTREKIMSRICGVHVVCGDIDEAFAFYVDDLVAGGGNLQSAVWREAIYELEKRLHEQGFQLPGHWSCTFDNCGENKNYTCFGYFAYLVEMDLFHTIDLHTMVVGHTHCPLDQTLGSWATIIKEQDFVATPMAIETLLQKIHEGAEGYRRPRVMRKIDVVYDLQSVMEAARNPWLNYVFLPHYYRFNKHKITRRARLLYAMFSGMPLLPLEEELEIVAYHDDGEPVYRVPEVDNIETMPLCHVGGKAKFFNYIGLNKKASAMTSIEAQRMAVVSELESTGVFAKLQVVVAAVMMIMHSHSSSPSPPPPPPSSSFSSSSSSSCCCCCCCRNHRSNFSKEIHSKRAMLQSMLKMQRLGQRQTKEKARKSSEPIA